MKQSWKEFLELAAVFAIVLSLLLVAYQIQQANRIAIATIEMEATNNFSSLNEFTMEHPEIDATYRKADSGAELTDDERSLLINHFRRLINLWRGLETSYKNGVLPESTYRIAFDDMRLSIDRSSVERRRIWREVLTWYPSIADTEIAIATNSYLDDAEKTADE